MKDHETNGEREQDVSFLTPNLNRLDEEWVRQPKLYFENAEKSAKLKGAKDRAKAELELAEAEAAQAIRANPQAHGHEKVTEGIVKELVPMQKNVKRALARYLEAQEAADVAQVVVSALDQKKHALQDAVRLRLANYFADPKVDEESGGKAMEKVRRDGAFKQRKDR